MSVTNDFQYTEIGQGHTVLILHGLFGTLSNFETLMNLMKDQYRFVLPSLPLYECELRHASLEGMMNYLERFVESMGLNNFTILGNSFGGHLALLFAMKYPQKVRALILTASSGLFESSLGNEYPKRDRSYLHTKILETFGNKEIVTENLVNEIESIVNSKANVLRIIKLAKSATRQNLLSTISVVKIPTLLVWGKNDIITPPFVAEKFKELMPNAELKWINNCGHAPMMEYPHEFASIIAPFLYKIYQA